MDKTISVVIPTFNRASTILRAINSALNQTYPVYEVIVVDDCSADNTFEIVESVDDSRVRIIRNSVNSGACRSRNNGIGAAAGNYIALLDSDDEWLPEKLEKQMFALEETGADVCSCRFKRIFAETSCTVDNPHDVLPVCPAGLLSREVLVEESRVSTQTILAKKEVFDEIKFDDAMPRLQDYEWTIRASGQFSFYLVDDVLVDVYLQDDSIVTSGRQKLNQAYEMILAKHRDDLANEPRLLHSLYVNTGRSRARIGANPIDCYKSALKLCFSPKTAVKLCLATTGIYK